jgi:flagellar basal body-associated protein FliL
MTTLILICVIAWLLVAGLALVFLTAAKHGDEMIRQAHERERHARRPDAMPREGSG